MKRSAEKAPAKRAGDYNVGYGKPPEASRFKKGAASPNPSGRPKRPKTFAECVHEELSRQFSTKESGRKRMRPVRQLLVRRLINDAMAGDNKAAKMLLDMDPHVQAADDAEEVITFTLLLEEDDPGPHWQRRVNGKVVDEG
jgi:hypothetical protein